MFNPEKLDWFNQQHIMRLAPDELARRLQPSFEAAGVCGATTYLGDRHAWFFAVLELLKPRAKRLDDFVAHGRFFFTDAIEYDAAAVDEASARAGHGRASRARSTRRSRRSPTFDRGVDSKRRCGRSAEARGVKAATLIHAVRVAVTGKTVSPGLFEVLALLGRERVHAAPRARLAVCVDLALPDRVRTFSTAQLADPSSLAATRKFFHSRSLRSRARRKTFS